MTAENSKSLFKRYLSPESYLTIQILVGLVLLLLCCGIFAALAENVSTNDPLVQFDTAVVNAVHANTSPQMVPIMLLISDVGYQIPLYATLVFFVYFAWKRRWPDLVLFILAICGEQAFEVFGKSLFHRDRPTFANPLIIVSDYSFPSGHAMVAIVFYGLLAYFLIRREKGRLNRVLIAVTALLIVLLVGFSRVYLGVHYPSDVLAGYMAGLAWLALTAIVVDIFRKWRLKRQKLNTSAAVAGRSE